MSHRPAVLARMCTVSSGQGRGWTDTHGSAAWWTPASGATGSDMYAAVTRLLLQACVAVCKSCGDECEMHAQMHAHCRVCAEACRRCEEACRNLLGAIS